MINITAKKQPSCASYERCTSLPENMFTLQMYKPTIWCRDIINAFFSFFDIYN